MATEKNNKVRTGTVVSDAMDKTIVVAVSALKTDTKYQKQYTSTKKYKVHDEDNAHKIGDKVSFVQVRPISKDKSFRTVEA